MMKSCKYCGRFHKAGEVCKLKPKPSTAKRKRNKKDDFRNTVKWQEKRNQIRQRDFNCCQVCLVQPAPNCLRVNTKNLSVHHIVPLEEDFSKRLDNDNLITLCSYHHAMAEDGEIDAEYLKALICNPPLYHLKNGC